MKRALLTILVAAALLPAVAEAGMRPPGVTRSIAEVETRATLQKIASWRYRDDGWLDCRRGKINRTRWACRFAWYRGNYCRRGRMQVYGFLEGGERWYGTRGRTVRCTAP